MRTSRRTGFSLLELLVILAIFAILLGLLLPAIWKVRQAASRMNSMNNMKQLALACHNYHDVNGMFPSGVDDNHFSAGARLLPYVEQQNVFNLIDFKKPMEDPANNQVRQTLLKVFVSDQDPVPLIMPGAQNGPTNYLFNAGSKYDLADNDGIFFLNSKVRLADITDGTSNTLLTGETLRGDGANRAVDVHRQYVELDKDALKGLKEDSGVQEWKANQNIVGNRGSSWMDGRFLQGTFTGTRVANDERPDVNCAGTGGLSALRNLPNLPINVGMCDGSVRAIGKPLDLTVWNHLTSRNDGNVLPDF